MWLAEKLEWKGLILRRNDRGMIKMHIHVKYRYSCQILKKHEFSRRILEK
jgi:hypothetical protein